MKGMGGCVQNIGHEHDFCQARKADNTDPRKNSAVKYATACGHLKINRSWRNRRGENTDSQEQQMRPELQD